MNPVRDKDLMISHRNKNNHPAPLDPARSKANAPISNGMNTKRGIIQLVVIIIIILIILGYFGLNLQDVIESPTVNENLSYAWSSLVQVWQTYLAAPAAYLWGVFKNLLWGSFISNLESIKKGEPNSLESNAPYIGTTTP